MNRNLSAIILAVALSACGEVSLKPTVTLSQTEAKLLRRGTQWSISAPLSVNLPPASSNWKLVATADEKSSTGFLEYFQGQTEFAHDAPSFELPLKTRGTLRSGVETRIRVFVTVFVWNGGLESDSESVSAEYAFVGQ